jgi:hypothetical protein
MPRPRKPKAASTPNPAQAPASQPPSPGDLAGALFDMGFALPPGNDFLERLVTVEGTAQQLEDRLKDYLQWCLGSVQITQSRCQNCVLDAIQAQLGQIETICQGNQLCVEQHVAGLTGRAWEYAGSLGCSLPGMQPPSFPEAPPSTGGGGFPVPPIFTPPGAVGVVSPGYPVPFDAAPGSLGIPSGPVVSFGGVITPQAVPGAFQGPLGGGPGFGRPPVAIPGAGAPPLQAGLIQVGVGQPCPPGTLPHCQNATQINAWINGDATRPPPALYCVQVGTPGYQQSIDIAGNACLWLPPGQQSAPNLVPAPATPPATPCAQCCCCPCTCEPKEPEPKPPAPPPPPPPEDEDWHGWYSQVTGECYVTGPGEAKRHHLDVEVASGSDAAAVRAETYAKCPKDPPPTKPTTRWGGFQPIHALNWCHPQVCELIDNLLKSFTAQGRDTLAKFIGVQNPDGTVAVPADGAFSIWPLSMFANFVNAVLTGIFTGVDGAVKSFMPPNECSSPANIVLTFQRICLSFLSRYVGDAFDEIKIPIDYMSRYICPTRIPEADAATNAFLTNSLSEEQLRCYIQANGYCWEPWRTVVDSKRSRPGPIELRDLRLRGMIGANVYNQGMRELGFTKQADIDLIFALSDQVPFPSDLIRMMVRDVENPAIVQGFGLDDGFNVNWAGKLKDWGKSQGIGDDYAKYLWRAHWNVPSPTQLYTMYHRLSRLPAGDPNRVTLQDVETALKQDDNLPFWVPKLLAIAHSPLNRTDAIKAYKFGAINAARVEEAFKDLGYEDRVATELTATLTIEKKRSFRTSKWVQLYSQGAITFGQAESGLRNDGADDATISEVLQIGLWQFAARSRRRCIAALRKRFLAGEFDEAGALQELVGQSIDPEQATLMARHWACERAARGKEASVSQLCRWLELGLIQPNEFVQRAMRLGWDDTEAIMLLNDCEARLTLKQTRAAEALAKRIAADQAKRDALARRRAGELSRAQAANARNLAAARKATERREDLLIDAAQTLQKKIGGTVQDAIRECRRVLALLRQSYSQSADDAIETVVRAAESVPKGNRVAFEDLAIGFAVANQEAESEVSGNGSG